MSSDIEKLFKPLVFECNVNCKCKAECRNRVVQDRMKWKPSTSVISVIINDHEFVSLGIP